MCGVFGYIGKRKALDVCLKGLEQLEYRGYDSTGIAGIHQGELVFCKRAGKLSQLREKLDLPTLELAIAHTRWATHGRVNDQNAHPHFDTQHTIALVHNGIIENFDSLREELKKEDVSFSSETDTEVIVQLVAKYYQGDLAKALHQTVSRLKGVFALVAIHKDHPDELVATVRECPLSVAYDDEGSESIISSDPNTFIGKTLNVLFLREGEMARVRQGAVQIFDQNLKEIQKKTERFEAEFKAPSKEGFAHYMIKEIYEQPNTIQKAFLGRFDAEIQFEECRFSDSFFKEIRNIWILGCGTSWHAGSIGALLLEDFARLPASAEIASEARYRTPLLSPETLVCAISQSGETADTLAAMREARKYGCKVLGICNVKNSTLSREADSTLFLKAGPEISVCSTKAFTSQLTVLLLLAFFLGRVRGHLSEASLETLHQTLKKIPQQIQEILDRAGQLEKLAQKYAAYEDFFFMGRRYMFPTCLEAALKLKEISYVNANGYPGGELKHGPIALLNPQFPVIGFAANEQTQEKILSNLMEVKARGAPVLAFAPETLQNVKGMADDIFWLPHAPDAFAPFCSTVAGQLLAYFIAKARGCDIDQPRHLAKSVTVE